MWELLKTNCWLLAMAGLMTSEKRQGITCDLQSCAVSTLIFVCKLHAFSTVVSVGWKYGDWQCYNYAVLLLWTKNVIMRNDSDWVHSGSRMAGQWSENATLCSFCPLTTLALLQYHALYAWTDDRFMLHAGSATSSRQVTWCKGSLDVRIMQWETNHCLLTALVPLRKVNLMPERWACQAKQSYWREVTACRLECHHAHWKKSQN